ncbi:MAG: CoA pyrophosphatase [Thermoanaerobaculum sp.]|nr:CoA pyrophosphatase [Thermoanaerobaculum sp.]MDW7966630.1 CoA pyrophosphatase [Thermoanaerobaculum sp.]
MWFEEVARRLEAKPVRRLALSGATPAAVLVPLYVAGGELWVLLTRRADHLLHHPGQYAFPGGAKDPEDRDEVATALREAREELGIVEESVMVLGHLNDLLTVTNFVISPVVGALPYPHVLQPDPREVAAVVPVPFSVLANPLLVEEQEFVWQGERVRSPVLHYGPHRIWGATARMLLELVERLTSGEEGGAGPKRSP